MITQRNIQDESFDSMTVNGMPALFTNFRIDRNAVPEGHAYDIRESDDGGRFATIEPEVMVNHAGTILTREKLVMGENGYVQIEEYGFEDSMTLDEWLLPQVLPWNRGVKNSPKSPFIENLQINTTPVLIR